MDNCKPMRHALACAQLHNSSTSLVSSFSASACMFVLVSRACVQTHFPCGDAMPCCCSIQASRCKCLHRDLHEVSWLSAAVGYCCARASTGVCTATSATCRQHYAMW